MAQRNILRKIAYAGAIIFGILEAGSSKVPPSVPVHAEFRTLDEVVMVIKNELGNRIRQVVYVTDDAIVEKIVTALGIQDIPPSQPKDAKPAAEQSLQEHWQNAGDAWRWLITYQQKPQDMVDPADIDCNDYAHDACKRLREKGIPMYYCNRTAKESLLESWHQEGICKVGNSFILIDNDCIVVLNNMLPQTYFTKHSEMQMAPVFGICKDEDSNYTFGIARFIQTGLNATSVENMRAVRLRSNALLASAKPASHSQNMAGKAISTH